MPRKRKGSWLGKSPGRPKKDAQKEVSSSEEEEEEVEDLLAETSRKRLKLVSSTNGAMMVKSILEKLLVVFKE